jgi:hypothetical protein
MRKTKKLTENKKTVMSEDYAKRLTGTVLFTSSVVRAI